MATGVLRSDLMRNKLIAAAVLGLVGAGLVAAPVPAEAKRVLVCKDVKKKANKGTVIGAPRDREEEREEEAALLVREPVAPFPALRSRGSCPRRGAGFSAGGTRRRWPSAGPA